MVVIMDEHKEKEFHLNQQVAVLNSDGLRVGIGMIVNINEYRSPDERFAVYMKGYSDVVFLGVEQLDYLE